MFLSESEERITSADYADYTDYEESSDRPRSVELSPPVGT